MANRQIIISVPEEFLEGEQMDGTEFARELTLLAAVKLFELGRLSSGRAAKLAGLSRIEFLDALERFRVFPLAEELEELEHSDG